jgi:hypothetical protein
MLIFVCLKSQFDYIKSWSRHSRKGKSHSVHLNHTTARPWMGMQKLVRQANKLGQPVHHDLEDSSLNSTLNFIDSCCSVASANFAQPVQVGGATDSMPQYHGDD